MLRDRRETLEHAGSVANRCLAETQADIATVVRTRLSGFGQSSLRGASYAATSPRDFSSMVFGWAPTAAAAGSPSLKRTIVGMLITP